MLLKGFIHKMIIYVARNLVNNDYLISNKTRLSFEISDLAFSKVCKSLVNICIGHSCGFCSD